MTQMTQIRDNALVFQARCADHSVGLVIQMGVICVHLRMSSWTAVYPQIYPQIYPQMTQMGAD